MDRKKLGALLIAFITGAVLSAGSVLAEVHEGVRGYVLGDPSHGKLVPFFRVGPTLATIIGIENELHEPEPLPSPGGGPGITVIHGDILVHVAVFTKRSTEIFDFDLCLSPFDFGFIVLQSGPETPKQIQELRGDVHDAAFNRQHKAKIITLGELGAANNEGYVTLKVVQEFFTTDGICNGSSFPVSFDAIDAYITTWAVLADVGKGFFATEVPTPTVVVDDFTGGVTGLGRDAAGEIVESSLGLIPGPTPNPFGTTPPTFHGIPDNPLLLGTIGGDRDLDKVVHQNPVWGGNEVLARYDVNPALASQTEIFVWLKRNAFAITPDVEGIQRSPSSPGYLYCEDEKRISVIVPLPDEVNIIDPASFGGLGECKSLNQFRGVLEFLMPDTGFLFSQITQNSDHFRQTYLGYNLDTNGFIDCADDVNDFGESADGLCSTFDED